MECSDKCPLAEYDDCTFKIYTEAVKPNICLYSAVHAFHAVEIARFMGVDPLPMERGDEKGGE
jgi:hypothetical protein